MNIDLYSSRKFTKRYSISLGDLCSLVLRSAVHAAILFPAGNMTGQNQSPWLRGASQAGVMRKVTKWMATILLWLDVLLLETTIRPPGLAQPVQMHGFGE